eukprot:722978_1
MAPSRTYLSIITLSLIQYANCQTGEGCYSKTCPHQGQVRINAIFNANGAFLGAFLGARASPDLYQQFLLEIHLNNAQFRPALWPLLVVQTLTTMQPSNQLLCTTFVISDSFFFSLFLILFLFVNARLLQLNDVFAF